MTIFDFLEIFYLELYFESCILWKYSSNRFFFHFSFFLLIMWKLVSFFWFLEMHVKLNSTFYGFQILNQVRNVVCETLFLKFEIKWQVCNYAVLLIGTCKMFLKICLNIWSGTYDCHKYLHICFNLCGCLFDKMERKMGSF